MRIQPGNPVLVVRSRAIGPRSGHFLGHVRVEAETTAISPDSLMPANPPVLGVSRAVE
jgi:hypothetical protein